MNTITINKTLCIGCQICYRSCFVDVFRWDKENRRPIVAYPEDCVHCTYCEVCCPQRALKMCPDYESYLFPRDLVTTNIE